MNCDSNQVFYNHTASIPPTSLAFLRLALHILPLVMPVSLAACAMLQYFTPSIITAQPLSFRNAGNTRIRRTSLRTIGRTLGTPNRVPLLHSPFAWSR